MYKLLRSLTKPLNALETFFSCSFLFTIVIELAVEDKKIYTAFMAKNVIFT
jgi:hypothetical protein